MHNTKLYYVKKTNIYKSLKRKCNTMASVKHAEDVEKVKRDNERHGNVTLNIKKPTK